MCGKLTWRNIASVLESAGVDDYYIDYDTGIAYIPFRTEAEELAPAEWEERKRARRRAMLERARWTGVGLEWD